MPRGHFSTTDPRRIAQNLARQGQEVCTQDAQQRFLVFWYSWLVIKTKKRELPQRTQFSTRPHQAVGILDHNAEFAMLVQQPRCSATTVDTVVLMGRHALFSKTSARLLHPCKRCSVTEKAKRWHSSLKGRRMRQNTRTTDGVAQSTFYSSSTPDQIVLPILATCLRQ